MIPRMKYLLTTVILAIALVIGTIVFADDGPMFRQNVSNTPDQLTGDAAIKMLPFYVPAQTAAGEKTSIIYENVSGEIIDSRAYARPLIAVYIDNSPYDLAGGFEAAQTGTGFAARDAYAAVSLDDGATWRKTNLSNSANQSSFYLKNGLPYPGDVFRLDFAVVENRILAAWISRFCEGDTAAYNQVNDSGENLYPDLFGVAGDQGSVDYTFQGYPEIGEIPYGCIWTARGVFTQTDSVSETYGIVWRRPEQLTSGRRDANVQVVAGAKEAGFVLVWQEDPEGLRPGQGLGPGEGWSGAVVNPKTDMWYSYISWNAFELITDTIDTSPVVAVPFMVPIRISDNDMCLSDQLDEDEYCLPESDLNASLSITNTLRDYYTVCNEAVSWTNPSGTTLNNICKTEDGRVLNGRTGASRTRLGLMPYTRPDGTTSAWVVMAYEETKALGDVLDPITQQPIDIGKNVIYHTFDMFAPDMVAAGMQLNQPAIDPTTDEFFAIHMDDWGNEFYESEIARRSSLIIQPSSGAIGTDGKTTLLALFKQGIINQGGPADIMFRRFVLPNSFDPAAENPYAYENMVCSSWAYTGTTVISGTTTTIPENPNYPHGLCMDNPVNISGVEMLSCDNGTSGNTCADSFPWQGGSTGTFPKVTAWQQVPSTLSTQSWENPFDIAKGHRGFIDGDFVMLMYAWSPNWKANSIGNDKYNLYIRRSFDGGETWTTTPAEAPYFGNGTSHGEYMPGIGDLVINNYGPGEFEQARNVSQLTSSRITVLDPRFTPTTASILGTKTPEWPFYYPGYLDDARDRSHFFVVYETGDNTVLPEFAAVPFDLYYSRAYAWGDNYDYIEVEHDGNVVERWDWLENEQDDLSSEASLTASPAGNFFYSVWNQWNELVEGVITNSDMIFRRVMYLDETTAMPGVEILYVSSYSIDLSKAGELVILASARDYDHMGTGDDIVAYIWQSSIDGYLGDTRDLHVQFAGLSPGMHRVTISVQDNEGDWGHASVHIFVAEDMNMLYFPEIKND